MMSSTFVRLAAVLPLLAVATAHMHRIPKRGDDNQCSTGSIQCCESTQQTSSPGIATILGLLGAAVPDVDVLVGLTCSPITVIGAGGGGDCSAQTVCCEDNSHGGLVSIGCVPVTL